MGDRTRDKSVIYIQGIHPKIKNKNKTPFQITLETGTEAGLEIKTPTE